MNRIELRVCKNGDDIFLVWRIQKPIKDCRGFAVYGRRNGTEELLPSHAGFENEKWKRGEHQPSTLAPERPFWCSIPWSGFTASPRTFPFPDNICRGIMRPMATGPELPTTCVARIRES
jgi:hypothetical protein